LAEPCPAQESPVQLASWKPEFASALIVTASVTLAMQLAWAVQPTVTSVTVAVPLALLPAAIVTHPTVHAAAACAT
jgi:hypothetical protein